MRSTAIHHSCLGLLAATAVADPAERRQSTTTTTTTTAVVNFGNNTGPPNKLASGTLYGLPDALDQIPGHFFSDMGWKYERAGGAQLPEKGWVGGLDAYKARFNSSLINYQTTIANGGTFILLAHDLWGADGSQGSSALYPGDNGNWSSWDSFIAQLHSDMVASGMAKNLVIDIWNEPDISTFWSRTQDQYLQLWGRAYHQLRAQFGTQVLISGPASAGEPLTSNAWWQAWAAYAAANGSIPDQYSWHMEGGGGDLLSSHGGLVATLAQHGLPARTININEYAVFDEQVPAGSAWWIAQLERIDALGLRGNWLGGANLHDYLASLLGRTGAASGYYANGDYHVYRFYNQNMTGHRVGTLPSPDLRLDAYATVGPSSAVVLAGVRAATGTWTLRLNQLSALGLPASGTLSVRTWGFPVNASDVHYGRVDGPTDLGVYAHPYSGDTLSFPVSQTDETTAYAFEFDI